MGKITDKDFGSKAITITVQMEKAKKTLKKVPFLFCQQMTTATECMY